MGRHQSKPEVLAATIDKINEMIAAREWEVLDSYFLSLDPWEMSPEIMIAWVRTSYPVRIKLKNWKWFLERCRSDLKSRGFPEMFKGMS